MSSWAGRAVIVGAGVGGLTAAVALHQLGWQVIVLEQADRLATVGSGISPFANALRALDAIGLATRLRAGGQTVFDTGSGARPAVGCRVLTTAWPRGASVRPCWSTVPI